MKASTGVGIAGLVFAIMGAFTFGIGLYIGWVALILVTIAALMGDKGLSIATVIVSAVAFFFLTPSLWIAEGMHAAGNMAIEDGSPLVTKDNNRRVLLPISMVLLAAPIVSMFIHGMGKSALGTKQRTNQNPTP